MKYIFLTIALFLFHNSFGQSTTNETSKANSNYDASLAEKLGADDYGMKSYFLVMLKTGSNTSTDQELIKTSFTGHMNNINKMVADGKLIVAGPLGTNPQNYRGIFILDKVNTMEEAQELLQSDPAIKNKFLAFDIFNWYGSAALAEYLPISDKIWKVKP